MKTNDEIKEWAKEQMELSSVVEGQSIIQKEFNLGVGAACLCIKHETGKVLKTPPEEVCSDFYDTLPDRMATRLGFIQALKDFKEFLEES